MHLLWRRYARSGYAPAPFYFLLGAGFVGLAIWAAVRGDWLVMVFAVMMIAVTAAGSRIMRRMSDAADASGRDASEEDDDDR